MADKAKSTERRVWVKDCSTGAKEQRWAYSSVQPSPNVRQNSGAGLVVNIMAVRVEGGNDAPCPTGSLARAIMHVCRTLKKSLSE